MSVVHTTMLCTVKATPPPGSQPVIPFGATPPVTVRVNVTNIGLPSCDVNTGEGHEIVRVG